MKTSILLAALFAASSAFAQTAIDQSRALAGNVTPGDAPGFPITISQPGSYKLMSNLTVPANTRGIIITADNVTLDLNGFTLAGPVQCTQPAGTLAQPVTCTQQGGDQEGIRIAAPNGGAVIRNGTVRGFNGWGITTMSGEVLENLHVTQNGNAGLSGMDNGRMGTTLVNSVVDLNAGGGAYLSNGYVERCVIASNGGVGVWGPGHLVVRNTLVQRNFGRSLDNVSAAGTMSVNNLSARVGVKSMGGNIENGASY